MPPGGSGHRALRPGLRLVRILSLRLGWLAGPLRMCLAMLNFCSARTYRMGLQLGQGVVGQAEVGDDVLLHLPTFQPQLSLHRLDLILLPLNLLQRLLYSFSNLGERIPLLFHPELVLAVQLVDLVGGGDGDSVLVVREHVMGQRLEAALQYDYDKVSRSV